MKSRLYYLAIGFFVLTVLYSCKKERNVLEPSRQFMPAGEISATVISDTSIMVYWKTAVNADSTQATYTVQISKDSLFGGDSIYTFQTDSTGIILTDNDIPALVNLFARVKTNGTTPEKDSKWLEGNHFKITGTQILLAVKSLELKSTSTTLRWKPYKDLMKIVLTDTVRGVVHAREIQLTAADTSKHFIQVDGLSPDQLYYAQIFTSTKAVGNINFKTTRLPSFTVEITPADNLVQVLDTCSDQAVIGLAPGVYDYSSTVLAFKGKTIALIGTAEDPARTIIEFKELKLQGTGAGLILKYIEFDGAKAGADYFINLTGLNSDGESADFTTVQVENSLVHNYDNCFIRANRGGSPGDHTIKNIKVNNCWIYDNTLTNMYTEFYLDKLAFDTLSITNCTFNNAGQNFLSLATELPGSAKIPVVIMDYLTINNLGSNGKYLLFDANKTPVKLSFTNSIIANSPRSGSIKGDLFRASGEGSSINFSFNDYFKLGDGAGKALAIPAYGYLLNNANQEIDLGWNANTADFTIDPGSAVGKGSNTGKAIGDPRWVR